MKILVVDNYDSFTYNLVHYIEGELSLADAVQVIRNNNVLLHQIEQYDKIILSPGPGLPDESVNLLSIIHSAVQGQKPLLGVCLGHQAIAMYFGGKLKNLPRSFHGVSTPVRIAKPSALYSNIPQNISVGRYHSWVVSHENFPENLIVDAVDENQSIMSFYHNSLPVFGVQYHPESILTEYGRQIIKNFIQST